jgi:hypothetical protein
MAAPGRIRLVIDASVARAAGGEQATYPTAQNCRDFLKAVLRICHTMVCTGALREEWDRHASAFSRAWRVWMSSRDKLAEIPEPIQESLREGIKGVGLTVPQREAVMKDVPLIEAALATDHVVVSCDGTARNSFHHLLTRVPELGSVAWVNPTHDPDGILRWLEEGAKPENRFLLSS